MYIVVQVQTVMIVTMRQRHREDREKRMCAQKISNQQYILKYDFGPPTYLQYYFFNTQGFCTHLTVTFCTYYVYIDTGEVLVWREDMTQSVHSRGSLSGLWAAAQCDILKPHANDGSTPVTDGRGQCTETTSKMKHVACISSSL